MDKIPPAPFTKGGIGSDEQNNQEINKNKLSRQKMAMLLLLFVAISIASVYFYSNGYFSKKNISEPKKEEEIGQLEKKEDNNIQNVVLNSIDKANDVKRKAALSDIKNILDIYHSENDKYPMSAEMTKLNDKNSEVNKELIKYSNVESFKDPKDPEFYYTYKSDGAYYELSARLENMDDENCEAINDSVCIYKIDSKGNISKKIKEVLTIGNIKAFEDKLNLFENDQSVLVATSDIVGGEETATLSELNPPSNIKIKKASEVTENEKSANNFVLTGNIESNKLIKESYEKNPVASILEGIDAEKNDIKMTLTFSKSPWNENKIVLNYEGGYAMELPEKIRGNIKVDRRGDYYHIVLNTDDKKIYALVMSGDVNSSGVKNLLEFGGKYVEVYGYKRKRNSAAFSFEDSAGVIDVRMVE